MDMFDSKIGRDVTLCDSTAEFESYSFVLFSSHGAWRCWRMFNGGFQAVVALPEICRTRETGRE